MMSPAEYAPSRHDDADAPYREPLSTGAKLGVLAAVVFFHVGGAWALMEIQPTRIEIGEAASMEVRMVAPEQPPAPQLDTPPPEPEQVQLDTPPPDDTPPPEVPMLEAAVSPPTPDLPPPEFKMAPPPPPKPKPAPPPRPRPPAPAAEATPQPAAPAAPANAAPIPVEQLGYLNAPNPIYSARSRRAGEKGTVTMRVVVDPTGRPVEVTLAKSSGHSGLDEAAVSAMRAARIKPVGRLITVTASITFNLQ